MDESMIRDRKKKWIQFATLLHSLIKGKLIIGGHSRLGYYFWDKELKDYAAVDLGIYHDLLLFYQ
jgi:hypothetical protein